jgi:UDP:flavonoid glycosyltransferase YjiC (YdhE family)
VSRVLFAWELGEGLGHIGSFPLLAGYLRERGHEVGFALRDLGYADPVLGQGDWPLFQAPVSQRRKTNLPLAANFAEILPRVGYADADNLVGLIRAWRALFRLWRPDLVMFNHSPTALLAGRDLGFARVVQGTGFSCPAATQGRPVFPLWAPVAPDRSVEWERRLLEAIGGALERIGTPRLDGLADLVKADDTLLCTLPELDVYRGHRPGASYLGPVPSHTRGEAVDWPDGRRPRLFAYLKGSYGHLAALMDVLAGVDAAVLVYASGLTSEQAAKWSTGHVRVSARPVDTERLLGGCDLVICHGGHGTSADALLAGVPLLVLPIHVENWINGKCIAAAGVGLMVESGKDAPPFLALLRRLISDPSFRERARQIAGSHARLDRASRIAAMGERLVALL